MTRVGAVAAAVARGIRTGVVRAPLTVPLLLLVAVLMIATPRFLTGANLENILVSAAIVMIPALAMTWCLTMGEFDLSIGSTVALTGAVCCTLLLQGWPTAAAVGVGLAVGMVVGFANGLIVTRLGVTPFIATLATLVIVRGATLAYTGGRDVIVGDQALKYLAAGRPLGIPLPVLIALVAVVAFAWVTSRTRFGRWVAAVGSNPHAARMTGLPVARIRVTVYVVLGLAAAIWGTQISAQLQKGSGQIGIGFELEAITVVVIGGTSLLGGRASVIGTVVGVLLVATMHNGLNLLNVPPAYQRISVGLLLVAALAIQGVARSRRAAVGS